MEFKATTKLFRGIYQYKIVLVCAGAQWFRSGNWDSALENLKKVDLSSRIPSYHTSRTIKTQDELDYAFKLHSILETLSDIDVRVESPWISVYTNTKANIDILISADENKVKYVSLPLSNVCLDANTIVMPKIDFEFKVTLAKTTNNHASFIEWAQQNSKVKLTKSCIKALERPRSWGGTHFYITGEKNLLLARMHLGGGIGKVERIVKA